MSGVHRKERAGAVTDYYVITPEAAELVMQVIDGQLVIVPPEIAPQTHKSDEFAGQRNDAELRNCGAGLQLKPAWLTQISMSLEG